ncbi:GntR family transcriptional regulator [Pontibacillus salicampi]|uniref:GntR family transcriptional regulator n=1 Tax=Pontibacillus salicampi TaxID=1449801 RepID=A0ABV6LQB6_9BACI
MDKIKSKSLTELAYDQISQAILQNALKPGDMIVEEQIANQLGISRTPIREALKKLSFEGMIELRSGRRARVSEISEKDAMNYQIIRESLEALGAKTAAEHITSSELQELEEICTKQKEAIREDDLLEFLDLDFMFHSIIVRVSQNSKLEEIVNNLNSQIKRFLILSNTLHSSAEGAVEEHYTIIESLRERNGERTEEMMRNHVQNVTNRILKINHF